MTNDDYGQIDCVDRREWWRQWTSGDECGQERPLQNFDTSDTSDSKSLTTSRLWRPTLTMTGILRQLVGSTTARCRIHDDILLGSPNSSTRLNDFTIDEQPAQCHRRASPATTFSLIVVLYRRFIRHTADWHYHSKSLLSMKYLELCM
jgi:hypothetical protein